MLTSNDYAILEALSEDGGFLTRRISERAHISYGHNNRIRSGAVRSWLIHLMKEGLVAPLDNEKPVCWKRTPAGTAALMKHLAQC